MKKHLGSLLFFLLFSTLSASELYDVDVKVSNPTPFVKEAVSISVSLRQKDKSHIMYFDLKAIKNPDFLLIFEGEKSLNNNSYNKKVRYNYRLYPLKEGHITLNFTLKINLVTEGDLDKFISGNRNVIKPLESKEYHDNLAPIMIDVKPLKHPVTLVGDFKLNMQQEKQKVAAYEQVNVSYTLKGEGYNPNIKSLLPKIKGVESFMEVSHTSKDSQTFHYALIAGEDFTIPALSIPCFSPTKNSYYTLKTPTKKITVTAININDLVDAKDSLPQHSFDFATLLPYINGLLLFLAGYLFAKIDILRLIRKESPTKEPYHDKIKATKDEKALLRLLLSLNTKEFKPTIIELEEAIYRDKKVDLKAIKERLLTI
jgi:hypothetical protein